MLLLRAQEDAIEEALQLADRAGDGARVHVYGSREAGEYGPGEVVCGPAFAPIEREHAVVDKTPVRVVYHAEVVLLAGGGWACPSCGREGGTRGRLPPRPRWRS